MFGTQIHIITFIILIFQLTLFPFQIVSYLSRTFDKDRLRFLILNVVYFLYNFFSGLYPDPNFTFPSILFQNIIAYLVGVVLAIYYVRYIYLNYSIKPLKLFSMKQVISVLVFTFIFLFIIPYAVTNDLGLSRKVFILIPLILCLIFCYMITIHFLQINSKTNNYIQKYFKGKLILGHLSIISFSFLPIMVFIGDYQYIEQPMVNVSFFTLAVSHMTKIIYDSKIENSILYAITKNEERPTTQLILNQSNLTPSELDVAKLMIAGVSYKEIANDMYISYNTVTKHASNIFKKIGVKNKSDFLKHFV